MRNWIGRGLAASLVLSCFVGSTESTQAQQWANLEVTFIYDGARFLSVKRSTCPRILRAPRLGVDELLVVNPENKGIQNVAPMGRQQEDQLDPGVFIRI